MKPASFSDRLPPPPLAGAALEALGYALFTRDGDGASLRLAAPPPAWLAGLWPSLDRVGAGLPVTEASPFLENFLVDAAACWERGGGARAASGPWVENVPGGTEVELEATALTLDGADAALVIERLGEDFAARKSALQIGRETVLLNQRLNAEMQKKSILLHCIAEEMSASLANIITSLRLIERERDPANTQRLLDLAALATQEQQRHINRVLDGFAEELGDLYGAQSRANAEDTVRRALTAAGSAFAERRVRLQARSATSSRSGPLFVAVNGDHLERVLGNLLANALDATPPDREIAFQLQEETDAVRFTVEDPGTPLAPEIIETLFARTLPPPGKSAAALRLHFCRVVVEDCHGDIGYTPRNGGSSGGNRAWITVPKAAAIPPTAAISAPPMMKTVVLIESDALTRALHSQCLAGEGWRVLEADNGEAGLDLVERYKPAAVLCDIRTPRRNGFKVCRAIREQAPLQSTRVVLTSVSRFGNDRDTAFEAGASDYLVKPIPPTDLIDTLAACGDEPPEETPTVAPVEEDGPTTIRFWGVRGSIPTPGPNTAKTGGNTSCVEVRVGEQVIVLDAGSGARRLGQALMREFHNRPLHVNLLVTHTHWDHIQGFPFFIPAYSPKVSVRIVGYGGSVHGLRGALFEQMTSAFFPVALHQMASQVTFEELEDLQFTLGPVTVRAMFANHPGLCLGYRLCTPAGDVVYLPDHEAYERYEVERQHAAGENAPDAVAYARQQDEQVVEFLRGADVMIADSQYDAAEYPTRLGWGHTCADDTVALAVRAGVRQLFLFHHDPDHHDEKIEAMVTRARERVKEQGATLEVAAAREGAEVVLAARV